MWGFYDNLEFATTARQWTLAPHPGRLIDKGKSLEPNFLRAQPEHHLNQPSPSRKHIDPRNRRQSPVILASIPDMAAVYKSLSKTGTQKAEAPSNGVKKNKQRVLILSSRGVTYRYGTDPQALSRSAALTLLSFCRHRHLLNDIASMLPHSRKDAKFDSKSRLNELNELAELYNCNNVLFFEARKGKDLYLWLSKVPNGPTIKMHLQNRKSPRAPRATAGRARANTLPTVHTMEELHFTGNCLKGSRPLLSFDGAFDKHPHLRVIKELFQHTFGVPQGARKSKPFIDHVMGFSFVDGKIWVRNYQISEEEASAVKANEEGAKEGKASSKSKPSSDTDISLIEIGPRFVLTPIVIQEGSFGGPIIYENREFISPNQLRADLRRSKASRHNARAEQIVGRMSKKGDLGLRSSGGQRIPRNELDNKALFA